MAGLLLLVLLALLLSLVLYRNRRSELLASVELWRSKSHACELECARLQVQLKEQQSAYLALQQSLAQTQQAQRAEFELLAGKILQEKQQQMSQSSSQSINAVLQPFKDQIELFRQRLNEVHEASLKGQVQLESEVRRVFEVGLQLGRDAQTLSEALKGNKKLLGNWGELMLEQSLQQAGLIKGQHYISQASLRDQQGRRRAPDFVITLPDDKQIVLDSKVSLIAYQQALAADSQDEQQSALAAHVQAIKDHVNDLAGKDYSSLLGTKSPSFVFMYLPIEPAYIQALKHDPGLYEWAYRQNVALVSHTTLMPVLSTVANLWVLASSNEQARHISQLAGGLYKQLAVLAARLQKLGGSLATVTSQYNNVVVALAGQQGLYGKVQRLGEFSGQAKDGLPELNQLKHGVDTYRVTQLGELMPKGAAHDGDV